MGVFAETYGNTIRNKILEYIMEMNDLDFAVGDLSKELEISKPKCYEIISEFESNEYIKKSRIIGKTQLYTLNKDNSRVKLFINSFKECLKLVAKEQKEILVLNEKKEKYKKRHVRKK
jgi:DNA-binding transcriptional regulator GbsR (MarR family)